jgi:hypothetical protein
MKKIILLSFLLCVFALQAQNQPEIIWQKFYGGGQSDKALTMDKTTDGGCIVAGSTNSINGDVTVFKGREDVWIIKLDSTGKIEWQKTYGGSLDDEARAVLQTKDGGYIFTGATKSNDGDVNGNHMVGAPDVWVVKLDGQGNMQWQKTYGGTSWDEGNSIQQTNDGGYVVAASCKSKDGDAAGYIDGTRNNYLGRPNFWIIKLNITGNIQWQKNYGGSGDDTPYSIEPTNDGGYIVAGKSESRVMRNYPSDVTDNHGNYDYWVIKLDGSGNVQWKKSYGGTNWDICNAIHQTPNGYIMAGYSRSTDGDITKAHLDNEYWVVALDNSGNISWQKTYGGNGSDIASDIALTKDGGFLIAGTSSSNDADIAGNNVRGQNGWLLKINASGDVQWQKTLGGSSPDYGSSVKIATDGSIYFAGYSYSKDAGTNGYKGAIDFYVVRMRKIL